MSRSDEQIKKLVVDQLYWDARVDAADVQVQVLQGLVGLSGSVPTYTARMAAADDAWSVLGVRGVDNLLTVRFPSTVSVPNDDQLRSQVLDTLRWKPRLDATKIDAQVNDGVVTLSGTVDAYWKRAQAEETVGGIHGVRSIVNELTVVPTAGVVDEVIAEDVEKALDRNLLVDPDAITVEVENGTVRLSGTVPTNATRRAATSAAARTGGVRDVVDDLLLAA